jgi:hypothetical protein
VSSADFGTSKEDELSLYLRSSLVGCGMGIQEHKKEINLSGDNFGILPLFNLHNNHKSMIASYGTGVHLFLHKLYIFRVSLEILLNLILSPFPEFICPSCATIRLHQGCLGQVLSNGTTIQVRSCSIRRES